MEKKISVSVILPKSLWVCIKKEALFAEVGIGKLITTALYEKFSKDKNNSKKSLTDFEDID